MTDFLFLTISNKASNYLIPLGNSFSVSSSVTDTSKIIVRVYLNNIGVKYIPSSWRCFQTLKYSEEVNFMQNRFLLLMSFFSNKETQLHFYLLSISIIFIWLWIHRAKYQRLLKDFALYLPENKHILRQTFKILRWDILPIKFYQHNWLNNTS